MTCTENLIIGYNKNQNNVTIYIVLKKNDKHAVTRDQIDIVLGNLVSKSSTQPTD